MKQRVNYKPLYIPASLIESVVAGISFPFAAFGLLMDNTFNNSASFTNIEYLERLGNDFFKVLKISDNAKLPWTEEEFIRTMSTFSTESLLPPAGTDKKVKFLMHK